MKQKIHNNAMLELLTPTEYTHGIDTLVKKLSYNARYVRVLTQTETNGANQADAAGNFAVVANPPDGFLWSVMKITVDAGPANTAKWVAYINEVKAVAALTPQQDATTPSPSFSKSQVLLHSGDLLIIANVPASPGLIGY